MPKGNFSFYIESRQNVAVRLIDVSVRWSLGRANTYTLRKWRKSVERLTRQEALDFVEWILDNTPQRFAGSAIESGAELQASKNPAAVIHVCKKFVAESRESLGPVEVSINLLPLIGAHHKIVIT